MQGWVWVRGARGRLDRMYAMIKQRSLLYNATTALDRSDPGLKQVFLEGASARVLHNNAAMGEFEFEVSVGEETLVLRVESEAQETNWIAWVNLASSEEAWRDTLSKMFVPEKNDKEEEEEGDYDRVHVATDRHVSRDGEEESHGLAPQGRLQPSEYERSASRCICSTAPWKTCTTRLSPISTTETSSLV